jgi:hypothetical protein
VPLAFAPTSVGIFDDTLRLYSAYYHQWFPVAVSGVGIENPNATPDLILRPSSYSLSASPNPFNSQTRIHFTLPNAGHVELAVYDVMGRKMQTLTEGSRLAGEYTLLFDAALLPTGVYFVRLETAAWNKTEKLLLLK